MLTFMTGDPPPGPLSPFAEELHAAWGAPAREVFAIRRREEKAALDRLGAQVSYLGFLDCIYRGSNDHFFYTSNDGIFGSIHPPDAILVDALLSEMDALGTLAPEAKVYAPLAIGNHVDHQLVRQAAERWRGRDLIYYEDYPYAQREEADAQVAQRLNNQFEMQPNHSLTVSMSEEALRAKIDAIQLYASQLDVLFGSKDHVETDVRTFARQRAGEIGWAERFWHAA